MDLSNEINNHFQYIQVKHKELILMSLGFGGIAVIHDPINGFKIALQ